MSQWWLSFLRSRRASMQNRQRGPAHQRQRDANVRRVVHRQHLAHADDLDGRARQRRTVEQQHDQVKLSMILYTKRSPY